MSTGILVTREDQQAEIIRIRACYLYIGTYNIKPGLHKRRRLEKRICLL